MDSDLGKLHALISGRRHTVKPITQVRVTGWAGSQWFQYATDLGEANLPGRISAGESPSCPVCERLTLHELIGSSRFPPHRRVQKFAYSWQALAERPPSDSGNGSAPVSFRPESQFAARAVLLGAITLVNDTQRAGPECLGLTESLGDSCQD